MRLLIAGGGTGGHLFPGVALAEELRARDPAAPVLFIGTERGIEARVLADLGWDLATIEISGLKTVGVLGALRGLFRLPRSLWQSRRLIKTFAPDVVIGVGGYASGPVVLMARLMGIKTGILEQNSLPGLTNKILGKVVHAVFLCFAESRGFFADDKILMTGNPIRRDILAALTAPQEAGPPQAAALEEASPSAGGAASSSAGASASSSAGGAASTASSAVASAPAGPEAGAPLRVFVFGGSQGASAVNQMFAEAAALLAARGVALDIVHQTGEATLEATAAIYHAAGMKPDLRSFIKDMATEYRRADLVIARAGATSVAELGVVGRPALLIPYPFAADNHQEVNAREMADAGAALMLRQSELTSATLADTIEGLATSRATLERMGSVMKSLGKPRAAADIINWCEGS